MYSIVIKQAANHPLILRPMFLRFTLKKLHAAFTQCNQNLPSHFLKDKFRRPGEKVPDDHQIPEQFIQVDN